MSTWRTKAQIERERAEDEWAEKWADRAQRAVLVAFVVALFWINAQ